LQSACNFGSLPAPMTDALRPSHILHALLAVLLLATVAVLATDRPAGAHSGHAAQTTPPPNTLQNTLRRSGGPDAEGFRGLTRRGGESYRVRQELGRAQRGRANRRRSQLYLGQLTDVHVLDEMSPARVEFFDPLGAAFTSAHRPQEAFTAHVLDQLVRNVNRNRRSPVRQGNRQRRAMDLALMTGDIIDNQQLNEMRIFLDVLLGRRVDPFSGQRISAENPCPGATPQQIEELNRRVEERRYTGVQDHDDYPAPPGSRFPNFWDPNKAPVPGPYGSFPQYPGLMDRAQQPFEAQGLRVPFYTARGNHDGLVQGNERPNPLFESIGTGCRKVYPAADPDPMFVGRSFGEAVGMLSDPAVLGTLFERSGLTPPDPTRRFLQKREFKTVHGRGNPGTRDRHGFAWVHPDEQRASNGAASYYAFSPRSNVRLIALDTVADGGGASGNVDDPQYRWLERELRRNSSVEIRNGRVIRRNVRDRTIIVYGHHALNSIDNPVPAERAPVCTGPDDPDPGCRQDPRSSMPLHFGTSGPNNLRDLFLRFPNVVTYMAGHTHRNAVTAFRRGGRFGGGFYEIVSASGIDRGQHGRLVDMMDNRDGTLSLFGTVLDHAAPQTPPPPGNAGNFSSAQIASLSRVVAFNDPQGDGGREGQGTYLGRRADRNVELVLRAPSAIRAEARRVARGLPRRAPAFTGQSRR
jgi:hypothetical protein